MAISLLYYSEKTITKQYKVLVLAETEEIYYITFIVM